MKKPKIKREKKMFKGYPKEMEEPTCVKIPKIKKVKIKK